MHKKTLTALNCLENMIKFGQIQAGVPLPSERKLCDLLHVGRGAVRIVLAELERSGKIRPLPNGRMELAVSPADAPAAVHCFLVVTMLACSSFEALTLLGQLSEQGAAQGAEMVLSASNDWSSVPGRCQGSRYQGVAFFESFHTDAVQALERMGIPVMVTNAEVGCDRIPNVGVDFRQVGHLAGRALFEAGHRRIGYIGGCRDSYMTREITAGLKGALAEDDLEPDYHAFLALTYGGTDATARIAELLKRPNRPTAFMVGRDYQAQYFFQACRELRLRIPEDISVIGYDNLSWPDGAVSGLTTIAQPAAGIARETIALLQRLASGDHSRDRVGLPGELIRRTSVGPVPRPKR